MTAARSPETVPVLPPLLVVLAGCLGVMARRQLARR